MSIDRDRRFNKIEQWVLVPTYVVTILVAIMVSSLITITGVVHMVHVLFAVAFFAVRYLYIITHFPDGYFVE